MILASYFSCSEKDTIDFEPFGVKIDSLDIKPSNDYEYFELRIGPESKKVILSKSNGTINKNIQRKISTEFDNIIVKNGFSKFPHLIGFHYLISKNKEDVKVYKTSNELREFFGEIDTKTEAEIYVMSLGFPPSINDTTRTGVKMINDRFIVRASRMDSLCNPIITNRYTFEIDKRGIKDTLEIKTIDYDKKGCI